MVQTFSLASQRLNRIGKCSFQTLQTDSKQSNQQQCQWRYNKHKPGKPDMKSVIIKPLTGCPINQGYGNYCRKANQFYKVF